MQSSMAVTILKSLYQRRVATYLCRQVKNIPIRTRSAGTVPMTLKTLKIGRIAASGLSQFCVY